MAVNSAENSPKTASAAIYKICPATAWQVAKREGVYRGSPDDARDGFIHFSALDQVAGTLAKHFAGQGDLLLIKIESSVLGDALKWEASRGGALFPHLYSELDISAVSAVTPIAQQADGSHILPEIVA